MTDELVFEAPGAGDWWLVREHVPHPVSALFASLFPAPTAGWKTGGSRYGLALGTARWAPVNGWMYYGPEIPLTADELAEREIAAIATLGSATPWRDEVHRWHQEERPAAVAADRTLQAVDLGGLDDMALSSHLHRTIENFRRWAPLHFEHVGFDVAAGLLLRACIGWGVAGHEVIALLAGSSPASAAVDAHLGAIADALDRAGAPDDLATLAGVRAASPEAAEALDTFLGDYGLRPVAGLDLLEPTFNERPELVLASLAARRRRRATAPVAAAAAAEAEAAVRSSVPDDERDRFDELLADARAAYALRDDDVGVCWNWPMGLIRHTGLEVGRRLVHDGLVERPTDLFEVTVDELSALLTGRGPSPVELATRRARREAAARCDPPAHLAGGPGAPAPLAPPPAVAALAAIRDPVWSVAPPRVDAPLHGIGIGGSVAVGRARLVRDPDDLSGIEPGAVLVAVATTTAFNAVFPLLAAVVTELGGLLSHTAILARELSLPAVVGVGDVFEHVHEGDVLEVDGARGAVRVVDRAR